MPVVQYLTPSAPIVHAAVPASTALRGFLAGYKIAALQR